MQHLIKAVLDWQVNTCQGQKQSIILTNVSDEEENVL
jgi:hypothetical protein